MDTDKTRASLIRVRNFMPMGRRGFGLAAGSLAAMAALPFGRASAQTSVTFLGWQGYDEGLFASDFMQQNGIELQTTYIGNNDEIVTRLASGGVGSIDLVTPYMGYVPLLASAGLIQPIDTAKVPNMAHMMEPFRSDPNVNLDGQLWGVPFTWGSAPMMYNPAAIPEAPQSWMDLFKPEYAGKVGMMDDPLGNIMLAAILATDADVATMLTPEQLTAAIDFLIRVKSIARTVAVSWGDLADSLARNDVIITFSGWETIRKFAADLGAEIAYTYPQEGTYAWLDTYCIVADAPNPDAAHALCNEIIGREAQLMIGSEMLQGIVSTEGVEALPEDARSLYPYDDMDSFSARARFFAFPPLESDGVHATFDDWQTEYERFRTA